MPGIVVFSRRWSVGSDDLVIPACVLAVLHVVWIIVLGTLLAFVQFNGGPWDDVIVNNQSSTASDYLTSSTATPPSTSEEGISTTVAIESMSGRNAGCGGVVRESLIGFLVTLCVAAVLEVTAAAVSMRGTILNAEPRSAMKYLLYIRLGVLILEIVWQVLGVVWVVRYYSTCDATVAKRAVLGVIAFNWVVTASVLLSLWCSFDEAGRSWVKMKRYQESLKGREARGGTAHQKRCSGNTRRNWRQRKAMRKYEQSWDRRCRWLFCCVKEDRHRNSFAEIARLFNEFFRDLDVVPSDVVAGLVLLRQHQQLHRKFVVSQNSNEVYEFLSGVPITPQTEFLDLGVPSVLDEYRNIVHYMRHALAAYGWPMYMMTNAGTGLCKIMPRLRCYCCCSHCGANTSARSTLLVGDNCCRCNFAALHQLTGLERMDVIYATYHVDIGETPFYIAVDHDNKSIVISIRGTLSLQDVLTDLKADAEILPIEPMKEDWLAHKGMVQAATYIRKKIKDELLMSAAFNSDPEGGTRDYDVIVVGHSLGAGTAAILAILLRQEYPRLHCYAFSPPGGLLSAKCVEETKSFITSIIVGKDVVPRDNYWNTQMQLADFLRELLLIRDDRLVPGNPGTISPRIGLHQLEAFRQDIINVIKRSTEPKWKIIAGSVVCCRCRATDHEALDADGQTTLSSTVEMSELMRHEKESRSFVHPGDAQISLSAHTPLYLPGSIVHVVRNHPLSNSGWPCGNEEPVYKALKADKEYFNEVLISPTMVNDHMPDKVLEALEKVLQHVTRATSTSRQTNRTPGGDTVQQQQQQHVIVACFADGNEGDSGIVTSPRLQLGGNIDSDDVPGTPSCSTQLCETSWVDVNCVHVTAASAVCISASGDTTTRSIDENITTATPYQPGQPCQSGKTDDNEILRSPTVETPTVPMSRYPHLKAHLPTPLLPLVAGAQPTSLQCSPDSCDLNTMTVGSPTHRAVYRYSVDPPSPVGYADDSPDREVTPIFLGNDDVEGGLSGRFVVWNDADAGGTTRDTTRVDLGVCTCSADDNDRRSHLLDERNADADEATTIQQEAIQPNSEESGCHVTDERGSQESIASSPYNCQYLYDPFAGHYSAAGRGYPHGLHSPCIQCPSGSSAKPQPSAVNRGADSGFCGSPPPSNLLIAFSNGSSGGPLSGKCMSSAGRRVIADCENVSDASVLDPEHLQLRQRHEELYKTQEQSHGSEHENEATLITFQS